MTKWIALILGALLIVTNGFWLYSAIDLAATDKYNQQLEYESLHKIEALQNLCTKLVAGMPKSEAIKLLNDLSPDFEAYEKEGRLNTIWLSFGINQQGNVSDTDACE